MARATLAAAVACLAAALPSDQFAAWQARHGKTYRSADEARLRRAIFSANVAKIAAHNAAGHTWTMGVNQFADLTGDEFKARYASGYRRQPRDDAPAPLHTSMSDDDVLPGAVDWQAEGGVSPVYNQGQCGSCWAFSSTGPIETGAWLTSGKKRFVALSVQQIMDCSGPEGNQGCNGGLMDSAFQWVIDNGGICAASQYPYTGNGDGTCNNCTKVATITGYKDLAKSEVALMTGISGGAVAVAVEADQSAFQFYSGGVLTAPCGTNVDHTLVAVGYGTAPGNGGAYYKCKNSWGESWGEMGYIRLGRGSQFGTAGECGVQTTASVVESAHFL